MNKEERDKKLMSLREFIIFFYYGTFIKNESKTKFKTRQNSFTLISEKIFLHKHHLRREREREMF